jgi:hypothetical protein
VKPKKGYSFTKTFARSNSNSPWLILNVRDIVVLYRLLVLRWCTYIRLLGCCGRQGSDLLGTRAGDFGNRDGLWDGGWYAVGMKQVAAYLEKLAVRPISQPAAFVAPIPYVEQSALRVM